MERFGNDIEDFIFDDTYNLSCTFALMQIGEHVKRIDVWLNDHSKDIDWIPSADSGILLHNYGKVSKKIVWNIMVEDIPLMMKSIESLLIDQ